MYHLVDNFMTQLFLVETFYKWVYKDKNGDCQVTKVYFNEHGISPYSYNIYTDFPEHIPQPLCKIDGLSVTLKRNPKKEQLASS
jgi:hypothetical protein